jgi:hypothetical protein
MDTALDTTTPENARAIHIIAPEVTVRAQHHGMKRSIAAFIFCIAAILVSAVVLGVQFAEVDGTPLWVMVIMGAAIIGVLLTAILVPFLKAARQDH